MLFSGARIIILDEPTSALSPPEVERLFALLRRLCAAGRSILFISHFLDDVLTICDRMTVFRNGRTVATEPCGAVDKRWVIDRMIGAGHEGLEESYLSEIPLNSRPDAKIVLAVDALTRAGAYRDVSLRVREGSLVPGSSKSPARCSAGCRRIAGGSRSMARRRSCLPRRVRGRRGSRSCRRAAG